MQFRISHLLLASACVAVIMAAHNTDLVVFRRVTAVCSSILLSWFASNWLLSRSSRNVFIFSGIAGFYATTMWYIVFRVTSPRFVFQRYSPAPIDDSFTDSALQTVLHSLLLQEALILMVIGAIIGIVVAAWTVAAYGDNHMKEKFKIPVLVSKLALTGALVFQTLPLFDQGLGFTRDWAPVTMLCTLVFAIHAFNWVPRIYKDFQNQTPDRTETRQASGDEIPES